MNDDAIARICNDWISCNLILEEKSKSGFASLNEEWATQKVRAYSETAIDLYRDLLDLKIKNGEITEEYYNTLINGMRPVLDRDYEFPRRWADKMKRRRRENGCDW